MPGVDQAVRGLDIEQGPKRTRAPAGLLLDLAGRGHRRVFPVVDAAHRDLVRPRIGDETVAPHEQHFVLIVDNGRARARDRADHAVIEVPPVR